MMDHEKILRHLCVHLDADLKSRKCREIRSHLANCRGCRAYLRGLKSMVALYRRYPAPRLSAVVKRNLRSISSGKRSGRTVH